MNFNEMQRDNVDDFGRGSLSLSGDHRKVKSFSSNNGRTTADPRTAAQLMKLHRLVETLVIRELERGEEPHSQDSPSLSHLIQAPPQQRSTDYELGAGPGRSRKPYRHVSSNDSTVTFPDPAASIPFSSSGSDGPPPVSLAALATTAGRPYSTGAGGRRPKGHSEPHRLAGVCSSNPSRALEEGVQVQVATLQGQLAILGEQLNAAYRAAEGQAEGAADTRQHQHQHRHQQTSNAASGRTTAIRPSFHPGPPMLLTGTGTRGSLGSAEASVAVAAVTTGSGTGGPSPYRGTAQFSPGSPAAAGAAAVPAVATSAGAAAASHQRQHYPASGGGNLERVKLGLLTGSPKASQAPSSYLNFSAYRSGSGGSGGGSGGDALCAPDAGSQGLAMAAAPSSSGIGPGGSTTSRRTAEERAGREASAREDDRLRSWIQELRLERRRLEDRLLEGGDPSNSGAAAEAQKMREELEKQVLSLCRQRDQMTLELDELGVTQAANMQLVGQVEALEAALAAEVERVLRLKEVRPLLEGKLAEVSTSLESMRRQHTEALEAVVQERDLALSKARRSAKRTSELEAAVDMAQSEVRRLQDEVRAHVMSLAEMRASGEVLQSASQQMQANMEGQAKETATRLAAVQSQLEASQSECVILRRQLEAAQRETSVLRDQLKESQARLEVQASERSRLATSVAAEQRTTAGVRQQVESLTAQLKAGDEARADLAKAAAAQMEAVKRQHAADMASTQKQYESQLAVAEKQYLLLQRQYDAGLSSNEQAVEAAAALRRERDSLWAETQNLKVELEEARSDRNELSARLASLRVELRTTVDEVTRDRDTKLAAASSQHEATVRELKAELDLVRTIRQDYESKLANVMDVAEKMRAEAQEAQRQSEKYRAATSHLKDQVRDLLLSRDAAERELASERAFNEELNRILTTLREEQHQQHSLLHQQHQQHQRLGLGLGLGPALGTGAGSKGVDAGRLASPRA